MESSTLSDPVAGCTKSCWYDIVFPITVFAIAFVSLTVFCKCSMEIVKRFLPLPDTEEDAEDERISSEQDSENSSTDFPPSYSALQISLPRSETFPVDGIELGQMTIQRSTTADTILPSYNDIEKQKQDEFQGHKNLSFITIGTVSSSIADLPPYFEDDEDDDGDNGRENRYAVFEV